MAVEPDPPPGVPEWVVTFGDMMSLLLTFFIMLVSMSEIKTEQKVQDAVAALQRQFGRYPAMSTTPGRNPPHGDDAKKHNATSGRNHSPARGGERMRSPQGQNSRVRSLPRGQHVTVGAVVMFEEDSATLNDAERRQLRRTAEEVGGKPQKIEIRGHTSARPLAAGAPFRDHWDLAYARSRNVMQALVDQGIDGSRIRLSVAGPNEPSHIVDDPELLAENSRVEVFMLDELTSDFQGTREEQRQRLTAPPAK